MNPALTTPYDDIRRKNDSQILLALATLGVLLGGILLYKLLGGGEDADTDIWGGSLLGLLAGIFAFFAYSILGPLLVIPGMLLSTGFALLGTKAARGGLPSALGVILCLLNVAILTGHSIIYWQTYIH